MTARGSRRLEPGRELVADERPRPAEPEHAVVSLQRAVGNAAVARLLARAPTATALPPGATRLGEFRQWAAGLRDLATLAKPPVSVSDSSSPWARKLSACRSMRSPMPSCPSSCGH